MTEVKDLLMKQPKNIAQVLSEEGFAIKNDLFSSNVMDALSTIIEKSKKAANTFAIRQFLENVPSTIPFILQTILNYFSKKILATIIS